MRKPFFNRRRVLAAVALGLLVLTLLPEDASQWLTRLPRHAIGALTYPSLILKRVSDTIRPGANRPSEYGSYDQRKVQQLERELDAERQYSAQLRQQTRQYQELIAQLTRVREWNLARGLRLPVADVTGWSGDAQNPALTIDRGQRHGLRQGLVVAEGANLVGRLGDVGPLSATVRLCTAPGTLLEVRLMPEASGPPGRETLPVALKATRDGQFEQDVKADVPVKVGDLARLADDHWPREAQGFVVGRVVRVEPLPRNPLLQQRIVVRPLRDLVRLGQVIVLVPLEAEQDLVAEKQGGVRKRTQGSR